MERLDEEQKAAVLALIEVAVKSDEPDFIEYNREVWELISKLGLDEREG